MIALLDVVPPGSESIDVPMLATGVLLLLLGVVGPVMWTWCFDRKHLRERGEP